MRRPGSLTLLLTRRDVSAVALRRTLARNLQQLACSVEGVELVSTRARGLRPELPTAGFRRGGRAESVCVCVGARLAESCEVRLVCT